jgi:hypothetical protein
LPVPPFLRGWLYSANSIFHSYSNQFTIMSELKSYQVLDEETGEIQSKILYITGRPRQYRFNGQNGQFNINGDRVLTDDKGKAMKSFTIIPVAWRVFEENLFGRGRKDLWGEIFFVDDKDCLSVIMLNNTSLEELMRLETDLHYDRVKLNQICLTMTPEQVTSEKGGEKKSWYIARMSYNVAPKEVAKMYAEFAADHRIYRQDTLTPTAVYTLISPTFYLPEYETPTVFALPETTA